MPLSTSTITTTYILTFAIARWAIEPYGVHDSYSGVTSNQAEGFNYVLKQLQEWHESPIECMVWPYTTCKEISRGKQRLGNYHLHSKLSSLAQMELLLISEQNSYSPEEIVGCIKDGQATLPPQPAALSSHEKNSLPMYQPTDPIGTCKMSNRRGSAWIQSFTHSPSWVHSVPMLSHYSQRKPVPAFPQLNVTTF